MITVFLNIMALVPQSKGAINTHYLLFLCIQLMIIIGMVMDQITTYHILAVLERNQNVVLINCICFPHTYYLVLIIY